jgi:biotin carboxyl carrier protein
LQAGRRAADAEEVIRARSLSIACLAALACAAPAAAADSPGGAPYQAPVGGGGVPYGAPSRLVASRPFVAGFAVGASRVVAGSVPPVRFRIDEPGTPSVVVRIAIAPLRGAGRALSVSLGAQPTGRFVTVRWPAHAGLVAGRYRVRLHATDPAGHTLLRRARASGVAALTVVPAPKPKPKPAPAPVPAPVSTPAPVLTQTTDGVFPVAGAFTWGDPFGVPRSGHIHQGQDLLAASGTPVVAPTPGTVTSTSDQAGGAGYYVVEHSADGRDFFFAHCLAGSTVVGAGQAVAAGAPLCRVGATGDATGPHLHFEIWVGGWHANGGQPIDPAPQLHRWGG